MREGMRREIFDRMKNMSQRLKDKYDAQTVILFGSHARGEETDDSDIDLFVIAPRWERFFERIASVKRLIRDLRNGLPVAPIVLTPEEIEKRMKLGDQFIMDILENGVRL
jgi:predicted nucleotidyltransferase